VLQVRHIPQANPIQRNRGIHRHRGEMMTLAEWKKTKELVELVRRLMANP